MFQHFVIVFAMFIIIQEHCLDTALDRIVFLISGAEEQIVVLLALQQSILKKAGQQMSEDKISKKCILKGAFLEHDIDDDASSLMTSSEWQTPSGRIQISPGFSSMTASPLMRCRACPLTTHTISKYRCACR